MSASEIAGLIGVPAVWLIRSAIPVPQQLEGRASGTSVTPSEARGLGRGRQRTLREVPPAVLQQVGSRARGQGHDRDLRVHART